MRNEEKKKIKRISAATRPGPVEKKKKKKGAGKKDNGGNSAKKKFGVSWFFPL